MINNQHSANFSVNPKVTLGICVRNCAEYLKDTLKKIADQDYPHELLELIFVDDGSEDNTLFIIKEYVSKSDISAKVFSTSWKGLGHARNMVVRNASADLILWVDGDMILSKDFVRKLVEFIAQNPEVGIAKGKQSLTPSANMLGTLESYARAAGRMINYKSKKTRTKSLGTGGSIYRVKAIRDAGGFDERLRGYGEDQDIEIRVRAAGWYLDTVDAIFLDYERNGLTWRNLWKRYWLRGYYTHYFLHKNKGVIKPFLMSPPAAFFSGLRHSVILYRLTCRKEVFLLPLQYAFKMTSWNFGYAKSHINSYEPAS